MRLLCYGPAGAAKPGLLDADDRIRNLSAVCADIDARALSGATLDRLRARDQTTVPAVEGRRRIGVPLAKVGKLIAIRSNYADNASEEGMAVPTERMVFMKANRCIVGPNDARRPAHHAS